MSFNVSYIYSIKDKFSATGARIKSSLKGINKELLAAKNRIDKFNKKFKAFNDLGKQLSLKVTAPMLLAGTAAAIMFGNFEEGLGNTLTLLDSTSPEGFAKRLELVAKAGIKAGFSTQDTTKALFDSVSALGANRVALETFDTAQKLAIGGAASLSISVDGLTSIVNAYGKETTKATDVANAFFSAQKGGKTTVAALASNVGKVAPSAKAAGIGFKTLLATMAQLTLGGLSTEIATTGLRGAINSLVKPSLEAEKLLKATGIASNAVELQSAGLVNTLSKLAALAKKNPNLIAKMIPEVEARTAIAALGEKEIGNLRGIIANINRDIAKGTGLTDAFAKKNKEFNRTMLKMGGNIKVAAISLGAVMAPVIKRVGEFIGRATEKFVKFSETHPKITRLVLVIAGLAAIVGPLLVVVGLAGAAFAAMSIPAIIIAAKIALIGGAIAVLITFWDDVKQAMQNVLDFWSGGFINGAIKMGSVIKDIVSSIPDFFTGGGEANINVNQTGGAGVASQTLTNNARIDGEINVNAPPGIVKSVQSKTTGKIGSLGLNLAGAPA